MFRISLPMIFSAVGAVLFLLLCLELIAGWGAVDDRVGDEPFSSIYSSPKPSVGVTPTELHNNFRGDVRNHRRRRSIIWSGHANSAWAWKPGVALWMSRRRVRDVCGEDR